MGHSALGAAVLDLPEHALLLNGICFFHYELKMSGQSEHPPCYRDLEPSFVWWVAVGLCHLSAVVSWSVGSVLTPIWWFVMKGEHDTYTKPISRCRAKFICSTPGCQVSAV